MIDAFLRIMRVVGEEEEFGTMDLVRQADVRYASAYGWLMALSRAGMVEGRIDTSRYRQGEWRWRRLFELRPLDKRAERQRKASNGSRR